jgi:hypothetical protein
MVPFLSKTANVWTMLNRGDQSTWSAFRAASDALVDSAKLAELLAMALRARGVDAVSRRRADYGVKRLDLVHAVVIWDQSQSAQGAALLDIDGYCVWKIVALSDIRNMLAAAMATPANTSSRDQCMRLVRGES